MKNTWIITKNADDSKKNSLILVLLLQNSGQISQKLVQKADFYTFLILTSQNWSILSGLNQLKPGG